VQNKSLSVIIPAFNEKEYIGDCIRTAKKLRPLEIIVVDGGSTDGTPDIAEKAGAVVIQSPKGRGIQMNKGASVARGATLLFLHADTLLPEIKKSFAPALFSSCIGGFFKFEVGDESKSKRIVQNFCNVKRELLFLA